MTERTRTITESMHAYTTEWERRLLKVQEAWRETRQRAGEVATLRTAVARQPDDLILRLELDEAEKRRREAKLLEELAKHALSSPTMQGAFCIASGLHGSFCTLHALTFLDVTRTLPTHHRRRPGRTDPDALLRAGIPSRPLNLAAALPVRLHQSHALSE